MWEITPNSNTQSRVFLLGSIHIGSTSNFPLNSVIEDSYSISEKLYVEVDTSRLTREKALEYIMKYGVYPSGDSIVNHISDELYKKLQSEIEKLGFTMNSSLLSMKPWLLASQITLLKMKELGYDATLGIDNYFINKANGKKSIIELESAEFQYEMLSMLPDKLQEYYLKSTLEFKDVDALYMDNLYRYWKTGDKTRIEELILTETSNEEVKALNEIIYDKRNINMVDKIITCLEQEGSSFIVVGAGHIVGKNGILELLKNKGYKTIQK